MIESNTELYLKQQRENKALRIYEQYLREIDDRKLLEEICINLYKLNQP